MMSIAANSKSNLPESEIPQELIECARNGDRAAMAQLLWHLQDSIFRFCLSQLGHKEAAEDATQETAVRLISLIRDFRAESQLKTFVIGIALNVCRESRKRVRRFTYDPKHFAEKTAQASGPYEQVERDDSLRRMYELLARLTDRQREVVVLRFLEQLSVEEAAMVLKVAPGTIKATAAQSLIKLREWWT